MFELLPANALINDINKALINAYKQIRNVPAAFLEAVNKFDEDKHCFNGLYRVNGKGCFNVPYNNSRRATFNEKAIRGISEYLQGGNYYGWRF